MSLPQRHTITIPFLFGFYIVHFVIQHEMFYGGHLLWIPPRCSFGPYFLWREMYFLKPENTFATST